MAALRKTVDGLGAHSPECLATLLVDDVTRGLLDTMSADCDSISNSVRGGHELKRMPKPLRAAVWRGRGYCQDNSLGCSR